MKPIYALLPAANKMLFSFNVEILKIMSKQVFFSTIRQIIIPADCLFLSVYVRHEIAEGIKLR